MTIADLDFHEYFPPAKIKELQENFTKFDADGKGSLNESEVSALFKKMNKQLSKQQVRELMSQFDQNKNGLIEFDEFCFMEIRSSRSRPRPDLIDYRNYLDATAIAKLEHITLLHDPFGKGSVGKPQIYQVLELAGCTGRAQEDIDEVFAEADSEGTGELDFGRFCALYAVLMRKRKHINYREFLTAEQVRAWRDLFSMVDEHGKGRIGFGAVDALFQRLGLKLRKQMLRSLFQEFDTDGSGDIDFEEFCVMILRIRGTRRIRTINPSTCNCWDLWTQEHFTIAELTSSGFGLIDFKKAGIPVGAVYKSGHASALQLRRAGFSSIELRRGGVSANELRRCGFSLTDLRTAGFSVPSVQAANRSLRSCLTSGDLSSLPQQRPRSTPVLPSMARNGLKSRGFPQFEAGVPCPLGKLPPRPLTPMIRDHTDYRGSLNFRPETS
jgi:Ca2+-binding EF-hand superfamily protein